MPVIVFSSSKGGAGKTTSSTLLACELARGASVTVIDADPNRNVLDWAALPGKPDALTVIGEVTEDNIIDHIEAASAASTFVVLDLPGAASLMNSYALSLADLVIIPIQGSQLDAAQAARSMKMIHQQSRVAGRPIPYAVLFTRTSGAIVPRTLRHIADRLAALGVPVLATKLYDREAYRAIFSYGGTLEGLADKGVSNLDTAIRNARAYTAEIVERLRGGSDVNAEAA